MKAAAIDRFGGPEELSLRELPVPTLAAGEVLIAVHTAGVGSWDADVRSGWYPAGRPRFPLVLGTDGSGVVARVGKGVRRFSAGDRVQGYRFENVFEKVGPSAVSVPGARAFHLPAVSEGAPGAFMVGHEFAHLHPERDGSLHLTLPPAEVEAVIENGWAERHPLAGRYGLPSSIVMVYGPRDTDELEVVEDLVRASHRYASAAGAARR